MSAPRLLGQGQPDDCLGDSTGAGVVAVDDDLRGARADELGRLARPDVGRLATETTGEDCRECIALLIRGAPR